MKYFKAEYLDMINSDDPRTREEGDSKWSNSCDEYSKYFDSIKEKLPKEFLHEYFENKGFHDCTISDIHIKSEEGNVCTIVISLHNHEFEFSIRYSSITGYCFHVPTNHHRYSKMSWGYDEFEIHDNDEVTHRVLCDHDCEFVVHFKELSLEQKPNY